MSESYGTTPSASGAGTTDVAKQEARATAEQVKEGSRHLADVGKDEARNVTSEAGQQAKQLWEQTRSEMADQGAQQQQRAAQGLRSLSGELRSMAHGSQQNGIATDLATQASQHVEEIARWLEDREPGCGTREVKGFARRRPGLFLAGAAALGVLGGRLSRGLVAEHQDTSGAAGTNGSGPVTPVSSVSSVRPVSSVDGLETPPPSTTRRPATRPTARRRRAPRSRPEAPPPSATRRGRQRHRRAGTGPGRDSSMSHQEPGLDESQARPLSSVGEIFADISRDLSTLMRQEVELAKAELRESATRAGKGAGMFGGAGLAGYFVLLFLSIAVWWGLGNHLGRGWSALIVALILGCDRRHPRHAGSARDQPGQGHATNRADRARAPRGSQGK